MHKLLYPLMVSLLAGSLFAADPFVGTWKLNLAKSKFGGATKPPKDLTFTVQIQDDQIVETDKGVAADGSPILYKYTFSRTGGEVKYLEGTLPAGTSEVVARNPDSRSADWTRLRNGKIIQRIHDVVSKDGKTAKMTIKGMDGEGKAYETLVVANRM